MLYRITLILILLNSSYKIALASYVYSREYDRPNLAVLELQLRNNDTLLFGQVEEVNQKNSDHDLKGFQFFEVKIKVDKIWSKKAFKQKPYFTFKFGTMVDHSNMQTTTPVKNREKLMLVLDTYNPNEVKILKDHLLSVYEHHVDRSTAKVFFVSKLTKHYSQKNLEFNDLKRIAYLEKMNFYSLENNRNKNDSPVNRTIASEKVSEETFSYEADNNHEPDAKIKRRPNSSINNQEEEFSVFSLLLVLVFLAIFSHFVIKYYESPDEEI
jgi:hypothetical protein